MNNEVKRFSIVIDRNSPTGDLPNMVVDQIVEYISNGTLVPGDKLPSELEMTRKFKISRISLREAMKLLEAKGYIESKGRQGKFIKSVVDNAFKLPIEGLINTNNKNLSSLLEVKRIIDGESASIAAIRAKKEEIAILSNLISEMEAIPSNESNKDILRYDKYDLFYQTLAKSTQNTIFSHMLISISHILREFFTEKRNSFFAKDNKFNSLLSILKEVVEAVKSKDAESAKKLMQSHIDLF